MAIQTSYLLHQGSTPCLTSRQNTGTLWYEGLIFRWRTSSLTLQRKWGAEVGRIIHFRLGLLKCEFCKEKKQKISFRRKYCRYSWRRKIEQHGLQGSVNPFESWSRKTSSHGCPYTSPSSVVNMKNDICSQKILSGETTKIEISAPQSLNMLSRQRF